MMRSQSDTTLKGKIAEMVVAAMHDRPGICVEQNKKLSSNRDPRRKREVDVLITAMAAGYPVRIAIECKNYKKSIDIQQIDEYVGKLDDIGIPPQCGIYVTTSKFSSGAVERAKEVGITLLILTGLTPDRLAAEIFTATQSVIYLLPELLSFGIMSNIATLGHGDSIGHFYDKHQNYCGSVPDAFWKMWIEDLLPTTIGEYTTILPIPDTWFNLAEGKLYRVLEVTATFRIVGIVLSLRGQLTHHQLIRAADHTIDRMQMKAQYTLPHEPVPVTHVSSEEDLEQVLGQQQGRLRLTTGRVHVPRILYNDLFWPISKGAYQNMVALAEQCAREGRTPTVAEQSRLERVGLQVAWEPIWNQHPILCSIKDHQEGK